MNKKQNSSVNYLDFTVPSPGEISEITPDIFWIRMPLPFELDHINLWLLRDFRDGKIGWTLIDTGLLNHLSKSYWKSIKENYFDDFPLLRIVCTHMHPDHVGMANWLSKGLDDHFWDIEIWMSHGEFFTGKSYFIEGRSIDTSIIEKRNKNTINFFYKHGCDITNEKR